MNKAIFFDRDGVLNKLVYRDNGFFSPRSFEEFKIRDNCNVVIKKLKFEGFLTIIVSNQPDISRGYLDKKELDKMTELLYNELNVSDVLYCMHDDSDYCDCRKPAPGLLIQAANKWKIDFKKSYMIGDTYRDAEAAINADVKFLLLNKDYNLNYNICSRIDNLEEILNYI